MTQMIGGHRKFIVLRRPFRLFQTWLVDSRIADQAIKLSPQRLHRRTNAVQITQIKQHVVKPLLGNSKRISSPCGTLRAAIAGDHGPTPLRQRFHSIESHAGGGTGDQNGSRGCHQAEQGKMNLSLPGEAQTTTTEDIKCCTPATACKLQGGCIKTAASSQSTAADEVMTGPER